MVRVGLCLAGILTVGSASRAQPLFPPGFELVSVATGLQFPTRMAFSPDGRLFVSEQAGRLRVIRDGALLPGPFATLSVAWTGERGLYGVAFDPEFERTRYLYVFYSREDEPLNRVSRLVASAGNPDVVDPSVPEVVLLDDLPSGDMHNGGALRFALDGTLFVSSGDAGTPVRAQSLEHLNGKLLRIQADGSIPLDNPFVDDAFARGEVWAYGLRNPFGLAFDPATGRALINDVGEGKWEEINEAVEGANYGWPECEGACDEAPLVDPIVAYGHGIASEGGCAITSGTFYRATQFPDEYDGDYLFADFCATWIHRLRPDNKVQGFGRDLPPSLVDLSIGPDGALYALSYTEGTVYQIRFVGEGNRSPVAVIDANPMQGPSPLRVSMSAEGSSDPDGDPLIYAWDFGDGSSAPEGVVVDYEYTTAGAYSARLTVDDQLGGSDSAVATIQVGIPPEARITIPETDAAFRAGDDVSFAGEGFDAEDGPLPTGAFRWIVLQHHHAEGEPDHHTHPVLGPIEGVRSGSFSIPREAHDHDIWYRIYLSVADSDGLRDETTRTLLPVTTQIALRTEPVNMSLKLDGQPQQTPFSEESIVGSQRLLTAPEEQTVDGLLYRFVQWSDGETSPTRNILIALRPTPRSTSASPRAASRNQTSS